ncbi:MAG: S9 family peptidase [Candidatus Solibacter usitatus]|nr:S9 family peptidase [Candidatus Solibacter usitatus]
MLRLFLISTLILTAKDPITHERLWMMKRVSNPAVSPDGMSVVFTITEPSYTEGEQISDLWLVAADGSGKPRRLTFTKAGESGVAWSPDSKRIAFSAKREGDEAAQIYILDLAGGDAIRHTTLSTGASGPVWSPDGKSIAFSSRVYPGTRNDADNKRIAAERKALKYKARVYDTFPIRNWDRWMDDLQTHLFVQPLDGGAAKDLLAGTKLVNQKGYAGVTTSGGDELQPVWSPDGKSLVIAAFTDRHLSASRETATRLYEVPVSGGEPKLLTPGDDSYAKPAFQPGTGALHAVREPNNSQVHNNTRLVKIGQKKAISASLDSSINSYAFSPDGKTVYITAEHQGLEKVYAIPSEGGEPRIAVDTDAGVVTGVQTPKAAGKLFLIALWGSAVNPAEVVRIDPATRSRKALTDLSATAAANIDWQPVRHFWFTSSRGRKIHNMVVLPPTFDASKKYPLFVVIHGGPHTMWRDEITLRWNYHLLAAPGYVVLLTNYTGSTGFGEKFAQDMKGDPFKTPGDEINEAADEAIRQFPFIDGGRQCAGGASYGGHMANWLEATTTRYKCLISHAGLINLESQWGTSDTIWHREVMAGGPVWEQGQVWREQNPIRLAKNFKTPILLTVGENDFRVPLNQTIENWSVLQRQKVPSRLIVFPDANHWILKPEDSRYFFQEVHAWLAHHLKK